MAKYIGLRQTLEQFCDDLIDYHDGDDDMISEVKSFREEINRLLQETEGKDHE